MPSSQIKIVLGILVFFALVLFTIIIQNKKFFLFFFPQSYFQVVNNHPRYRFKIDNYRAFIDLLYERRIIDLGIIRMRSLIPINRLKINFSEVSYPEMKTVHQLAETKFEVITSNFFVNGSTLVLNIGLNHEQIEQAQLDKKILLEYVNRQMLDTIVMATQHFNTFINQNLSDDNFDQNIKNIFNKYYKEQNRKIINLY